MANNLFDRRIKLQVGNLELSNFDCEFEAVITGSPLKPNTLKLKLFNLNSPHRKALEQHKNRVILSAGYNTLLGKIFDGETLAAFTVKEGPDWVTTLETGDGMMPIALANINTSMGPKASVKDVVKEIASSLGVKTGNMSEFFATLPNALNGAFGRRTVLSGNAARLMTDIGDSAGFNWSIQGGELQFVQKGKPLPKKAVLLSANTGLIGSPSLESKGTGSFTTAASAARTAALQKPGHVVTAKSLINPDIRMGGVVVFDSTVVSGGYRVVQLKYKGETRGQDWYVEVVGVHYPQG